MINELKRVDIRENTYSACAHGCASDRVLQNRRVRTDIQVFFASVTATAPASNSGIGKDVVECDVRCITQADK